MFRGILGVRFSFGTTDVFKMELDESRIADPVGIKYDLHRLSVAGYSRDHFRIGRIQCCSSGVSHSRTYYARQLIERRLQSPETTSGEYGGFGVWTSFRHLTLRGFFFPRRCGQPDQQKDRGENCCGQRFHCSALEVSVDRFIPANLVQFLRNFNGLQIWEGTFRGPF